MRVSRSSREGEMRHVFMQIRFLCPRVDGGRGGPSGKSRAATRLFWAGWLLGLGNLAREKALGFNVERSTSNFQRPSDVVAPAAGELNGVDAGGNGDGSAWRGRMACFGGLETRPPFARARLGCFG